MKYIIYTGFIFSMLPDTEAKNWGEGGGGGWGEFVHQFLKIWVKCIWFSLCNCIEMLSVTYNGFFFFFDSLRPINNLSVIKGRVLLG